MGWMSRIAERLKDASESTPIDCPHGWGSVAFQAEVEWIGPYIGIERRCPISGKAKCADCTYPKNPEVFDLRSQLDQLAELERDGYLSAAEHRDHRQALLGSFAPNPGNGFRITAWILGPIGIALIGGGSTLALFAHPGFWGLAGAGLVATALALSFAALASRPATAFDDT